MKIVDFYNFTYWFFKNYSLCFNNHETQRYFYLSIQPPSSKTPSISWTTKKYKSYKPNLKLTTIPILMFPREKFILPSLSIPFKIQQKLQPQTKIILKMITNPLNLRKVTRTSSRKAKRTHPNPNLDLQTLLETISNQRSNNKLWCPQKILKWDSILRTLHNIATVFQNQINISAHWIKMAILHCLKVILK